MTKRKNLLLLFILAIITGFFIGSWLKKVSHSSSTQNDKEVSAPNPIEKAQPLNLDGKRVLGLTPGKEAEEIKNLHVSNRPSKEWAESLEKTLRKQGGKSIKSIDLKTVDSFILRQDNTALFVESVIVTVTNEENAQTSFRVLVDSQTGKILKNWDQPVIDSANPRQNFRLKIDPRYQD